MKRLLRMVVICSLLVNFSVFAASESKTVSPNSAQVNKFIVKINTEYLSPKVASVKVGLQFSANPAPSDCSSPLIGMCPSGLSFTPMLGENNYACSVSSGETCVITESKSGTTTLIKDYWPGNKNYASYNFNATITLSQMDSNGAPLTSPVYQTINCLPASGTFNNELNQVTVLVAANGMCVISMD